MCASDVALFCLPLPSNIFLAFASDWGISRPALTITCWAIDLSDDMPSGNLGMRPLALDGTGEQELVGNGDDLLLTDDCGDVDRATGVAMSPSLLLMLLFWLFSRMLTLLLPLLPPPPPPVLTPIPTIPLEPPLPPLLLIILVFALLLLAFETFAFILFALTLPRLVVPLLLMILWFRLGGLCSDVLWLDVVWSAWGVGLLCGCCGCCTCCCCCCCCNGCCCCNCGINVWATLDVTLDVDDDESKPFSLPCAENFYFVNTFEQLSTKFHAQNIANTCNFDFLSLARFQVAKRLKRFTVGNAKFL